MARYLTEADVDRLLTPELASAAVEESLRRLARGEVDNPPRVRLPIPGGVFALMPCVDRGLGLAGLKTYAWSERGTPFLVVLLGIESGAVEAVVEADVLGQRRTAAASAIAAVHLARAEPSTLGILGAGRQAASHVGALRAALPSLERVVVHARDAGRTEAFCATHGCERRSAQEAAACDIVVTATSSSEPVLHGEWLTAGAFVCALGANDPAARELDDAVLARADGVYVDSRVQARDEAGDLIGRIEDWARVRELQDVVAGRVPGRERPDDVLLFKSSGLAAWDLAVAARLAAL